MIDPYYERQKIAETLAASAWLEPVKVNYIAEGLKAYNVHIRGLLIGGVQQHREPNHRMSGRIITSTTYSTVWVSDTPLYSRGYMSHRSRKAAVVDLIVGLLSRGWTFENNAWVRPAKVAR